MALDGAMLCAIKTELEQVLVEAKVDKIYQPSKEELVFCMRGKCGVKKLYISSRVQSPRIHITEQSYDNPSSPPMFCMLLRKYLVGAKLIKINQQGWERVLCLQFKTHNELGDETILSLFVEIMGRNSNIILVSENGKIIDAIKRVDFESSERPLLPGVIYEMPPKLRDRTDLSLSNQDLFQNIQMCKGEELFNVLMTKTQGLSPILCREAVFRCSGDTLACVDDLLSSQWIDLHTFIKRILKASLGEGVVPFIVFDKDGLPKDFSFLPITQYGLDCVGKEFSSLSIMLDSFYAEKDEKERLRQQSKDVLKLLQNAKDRVLRKISRQEEELHSAENREEKRIYGDLLNANVSSIPKGSAFAEVVNYYDTECKTIRIPLDPSKTVPQNAQKYYKEYRKAQTAEKILKEQIANGNEELSYIDSVMDALSRVSNVREIDEIREEMISSGYIRLSKKMKKGQNALPPHHFVSSDGFSIWVGRNNRQNDLLTLKTAHGRDMWLHTKNIPGSHVIIETRNGEPSENALLEAATLAAVHSKASDSAQVPVDYTLVKYVHKPVGAKPGKVIYEHQQTVYVKPEKSICEKLKA